MSDEQQTPAPTGSGGDASTTPAHPGPSTPPPGPERPAPAGSAGDDATARAGGEPVERSGAGGDGPALNPDGTPRPRRRRGSRGGRNRKRPNSTGGAGGSTGAAGDDAPERDRPASGAPDAANPRSGQGGQIRPAPATPAEAGGTGGDDHADPAADRGLTADDVAARAAEEAGVAGGAAKPRIGDSRPAPKPQIGDSRPAPPVAGGAAAGGSGAGAGGAKKRRRRGGRGRGRGGAGGAGAPATGGVGAVRDLGPASDIDDLDESVLERRRGRSRKGRPTGRYTMCVHRAPDGVVHLAVLEGRVLTEHYVSRPTDDATQIDGNIYLGRVQNVLPGMEAAFIDISTPKNGVLYRGDVSFDPSEVDSQQPRIETLLRNGQNVIVQVTKNPIGAKGARLTQEVSLAGRFVVMVPGQPQTYGISKRLPDEERKRLRKVLDAIRPDDAGLIVRTAAAGASAEELARDMERLKAEWAAIADAAKRAGKPCLLHREPPLVVRVIREEFNSEYRGVVIDDRQLFEDVRDYVQDFNPELADRVEYHDPAVEGLPLFEKHHVHEQIHKALDRKVWLPSGGSLIIEHTEALTVIDVNTGRNVGTSNLEATVFQNNLEAAEEVAHQLRLRDIGGIIVIDFIDMEIKENRRKVVDAFRSALARNKTRTQVFDISELGLVEMTRKRIGEGLLTSFAGQCPDCQGRGVLVDHDLLL
ncbi:MAG: Rne/Rng family ribonuclease [Actinomycetes bacterium]